MKRKGSVPYYADERIDDLMKTYTSILANCGCINPEELFRRVVNMPSRRFWVSAERAAIIISRMEKGDTLSSMGATRREMFHEIYRRAKALREKHPNLSIRQLAIQVVYQQAPKFYLTPGSARVIIYKVRSEWCRKKMPYYRVRYSAKSNDSADNR